MSGKVTESSLFFKNIHKRQKFLELVIDKQTNVTKLKNYAGLTRSTVMKLMNAFLNYSNICTVLWWQLLTMLIHTIL